MWLSVLYLLVHFASAKDCPTPDQVLSLIAIQIKNAKNYEDLESLYNSNLECARKSSKALKCLSTLKPFYKMGMENLRSEPPDGKNPLVLLPTALKDKSLIKTLVTGTSTPEEIKKVFDTLSAELPKDAKIFEFKSPTIFVRSFVIVIPSAKEDFIVHTHTHHGNKYNVIKTTKVSDDGQTLNPPKMEFFMVAADTLESQKRQNTCTSCHRMGTIAISPQKNKIFSHTKGFTDDQMLTWWNFYRPKDVQNPSDFTELAPPIGPENPSTRTMDFVKDCAKNKIPNITEDRVKIIRENMSCVECHKYGRIDLLRVPTHTNSFGFTILDNVVKSGHMPLGSDEKTNKLYLKPEEREALLTCLKSEYFGGMLSSDYSQGNSNPGVLLRHINSECEIKPEAATEGLLKGKSTQ